MSSLHTTEQPQGARRTRRALVAILLSAVMAIAFTAPASARSSGAEKVPVLQEWTTEGDPIATDQPSIGFSTLVRKPSGVSGTAKLSGLQADGVYTVWVIVIDPSFDPGAPDFSLVHVARGGSAVVGQNGKATVHWSGTTGQPSISGFPAPFTTLENPETALVRIEIAYHGQVPADGVVPAAWETDFWTGQAGVCPDNPGDPGPIIAVQPHCPVFYAATFVPA